MTAPQSLIRIPKPDLFSFSECLHFLDRGYDDCLYPIENNRVLKPMVINGEQVLVRIGEEADYLVTEILTNAHSPVIANHVKNFVTEWFDLNRNLLPFYRRLDEHPSLSIMKKQFTGLRLMGIPDLFEALCWCVIGQQINLSFAHRLKRRLVESFGTSLDFQSNVYYLFPRPELLAALTVEELRQLQFSRQKAEYIIGIAREFACGNISKSMLADLVNTRLMRKRLLNIRGVGEWTANYVLMKSLRRPDCIPFGDSGLNRVTSNLLELSRKPTRREVEMLFEPFSGWESYLVIYLWRTLS